MADTTLAYVLVEYYINGCIVQEKIITVTQDQQYAYNWKIAIPAYEFIIREVITVPAINLATITGLSQINVQTFNTPGAYQYTPSFEMEYVIVELVGGGGGGGGADAALLKYAAAGGGGGAGYCKFMLTALEVGTSLFGVIGAGGAAGAGGPNNPGLPGENTTLQTSTDWIAHGGFGGFGGSANAYTIPVFRSGGSPGSVTIGNGQLFESIIGQPGYQGIVFTINSIINGGGGSSQIGFGAPGLLTNSASGIAGGPGTGYGSGGSGAKTLNWNIPMAGGNGANGIAIFTEYV